MQMFFAGVFSVALVYLTVQYVRTVRDCVRVGWDRADTLFASVIGVALAGLFVSIIVLAVL